MTPTTTDESKPVLAVLFGSADPSRLPSRHESLFAPREVRWIQLGGSPLALLKTLFSVRADAVAAAVKSTSGRSTRIFKALALIPPARERLLIDEEGHSTRLSRLEFLFSDVPVLALQAAISAALVTGSFLLLLPMKLYFSAKRTPR